MRPRLRGIHFAAESRGDSHQWRRSIPEATVSAQLPRRGEENCRRFLLFPVAALCSAASDPARAECWQGGVRTDDEQTLLDTASGLNGKSVDLDRNNKQIAQGFDSEKASVLGATDRRFEILKVVVLSQLFRFISVVQ